MCVLSIAGVKLIGLTLAEVVGAISLILPPLTGIAVILSPIAGICLTIITAGTGVVHLRRKESPRCRDRTHRGALTTAILGFVVFAQNVQLSASPCAAFLVQRAGGAG